MSNYPQIVEVLSDEPVTATNLRLHSRIDFSDDDILIEGYIRAARQALERSRGISILKRRLAYYLDYFPYDSITLPWPPLVSVESLAFTDSSELVTTWYASAGNLIEGSPGTTMAHVDTAREPGALVIPYGLMQWPAGALRSINAIRIDYTAGYTDVPDAILAAIRLFAGHLYQNREAVVLGKSTAIDSKRLEFGVDRLLDTFDIPAF